MESGCWTEDVFHPLGGPFALRQPLPFEAPPSPLSSRAKPRDLRFYGPFLEDRPGGTLFPLLGDPKRDNRARFDSMSCEWSLA
jgi:hypothetical protein